MWPSHPFTCGEDPIERSVLEHAKQEKQSEVKRVNVSIKVDPEDTVQFPWLPGALVQERDLFFIFMQHFFFTTRKLLAVSIDGRIISLSPHYGIIACQLGV